jgi:hypothetical protein
VIVYGSVDDDLGTLSPTLVEAEILPCYVKEEKSFLWINRKSRSVTNFSRERRKKKKKTKRKEPISMMGGKNIFSSSSHTTHERPAKQQRSSRAIHSALLKQNAKERRKEKRPEDRLRLPRYTVTSSFPSFLLFLQKIPILLLFFLEWLFPFDSLSFFLN